MSNYLVSANDLTAISLGEQDTVTSVLQNIAVILSTPKGTVPGYREFGIDISDILDRPENVAQPMLCAAIKEAIERFEPRAHLYGDYVQILQGQPWNDASRCGGEHQCVVPQTTSSSAPTLTNWMRCSVPGYEQVFGTSVRPGSPERLFISWIEDAILYERALNNHADNQNLPSRAEGENLDALAELFYLQQRPKPTAATCTMRFNISEARQSAILIPSGHSRHGRKCLTVLGNHGR